MALSTLKAVCYDDDALSKSEFLACHPYFTSWWIGKIGFDKAKAAIEKASLALLTGMVRRHVLYADSNTAVTDLGGKDLTYQTIYQKVLEDELISKKYDFRHWAKPRMLLASFYENARKFVDSELSHTLKMRIKDLLEDDQKRIENAASETKYHYAYQMFGSALTSTTEYASTSWFNSNNALLPVAICCGQTINSGIISPDTIQTAASIMAYKRTLNKDLHPLVAYANKMVEKVRISAEKSKIYESVIESFEMPVRDADKVVNGSKEAQTSIRRACSILSRSTMPLPTPISVYKKAPVVKKITSCSLPNLAKSIKVKNFSNLKLSYINLCSRIYVNLDHVWR